MNLTKHDEREIPPNLCELVRNEDTGQMAIHVLRATELGMWEAWAVFPDTMGDEAFIRFSMLDGEPAIERLLMAWAPEGVVDQYQAIIAADWREG